VPTWAKTSSRTPMPCCRAPARPWWRYTCFPHRTRTGFARTCTSISCCSAPCSGACWSARPSW